MLSVNPEEPIASEELHVHYGWKSITPFQVVVTKPNHTTELLASGKGPGSNIVKFIPEKEGNYEFTLKEVKETESTARNTLVVEVKSSRVSTVHTPSSLSPFQHFKVYFWRNNA